MSDYITIDITRHNSDSDSNRKVKINIEFVPDTSDEPQKSAFKSKELLSEDSPTAALP